MLYVQMCMYTGVKGKVALGNTLILRDIFHNGRLEINWLHYHGMQLTREKNSKEIHLSLPNCIGYLFDLDKRHNGRWKSC